ncbi:MAG: AAC(3) family N-acetyltransferase [Verrucomicrobiota bacterium]
MGINQEQLASELRALGVRAGDTVMMHSSLSALGLVDGGAATVVDALCEAVGTKGTLLTPAFRDSVWGDLTEFKNSDCAPCSTHLCPSQQPGFQGAISEEIRKRVGSFRSCHPTHSWVALGHSAEALLAGHRQSTTPCGEGNPFEKLVTLDGCILTLGVGVDRVTLWHYYEEILQVAYLGHYWPKERHLNHCAGGRRIQYDYPGLMQDLCRASGILKIGKVGKSISGLMRAGDFESFLATAFADNPACLVLRPPDLESGELAIDALQKTAAMLKAWKKGPQRPVKKKFNPPRPISAPAPDDVIRQDCPAFSGFHLAFGTRVPLCKANGRHPDYFRLGGIFDEYGLTTCEHCSWHEKFPLTTPCVTEQIQ